MVGTDLNLTLPASGISMSTNVERIAVALAAIEASLADLVTPAALNINGPVDFDGNSLEQVSAVKFATGNHSTSAGSIYYDNGEFYVVDATSAIQLTLNGQINVAGVGGIVGDYGGSNPATVTYVDSSGQYVFTEDTGVYADVVCDDVILKGDNGSVILGVDAALAGTRTANFKTLPSSGSALLAYNSATNAIEDASGNTDAVAVGGALTAESFHHTGIKKLVLPGALWQFNTAHGHTVNGVLLAASSVGCSMPLPLTPGAVIKSITVYLNKNTSSGAIVAQLYQHNATLGTSSLAASIQTSGTSAVGATTLSNTSMNTTTGGEHLQYYVLITPGGAGTPALDELKHVVVGYTQP